MDNIFKSASKLVLLYLVFILGILALIAGSFSVITGEFTEAAKAILASFAGAITMMFGFYFANKGESDKEYLGK